VNRKLELALVCEQRSFAPMLAEDIKVRDFLKRKLAHASVGRVLHRAAGEGCPARPGHGVLHLRASLARRNMMRFSSCCAIESWRSAARPPRLADLLDVHMHLVDAHQPAQFGH